MTWEILWALILGFLLSAIVQALIPKRTIRGLLPDDSPRTSRPIVIENRDSPGPHRWCQSSWRRLSRSGLARGRR